MTCAASRRRTHQDDLLDVFGRAPVEHPRGVVSLYVLVHALYLLVPRDEERVVSNQTRDGREEIKEHHETLQLWIEMNWFLGFDC